MTIGFIFRIEISSAEIVRCVDVAFGKTSTIGKIVTRLLLGNEFRETKVNNRESKALGHADPS